MIDKEEIHKNIAENIDVTFGHRKMYGTFREVEVSWTGENTINLVRPKGNLEKYIKKVIQKIQPTKYNIEIDNIYIEYKCIPKG